MGRYRDFDAAIKEQQAQHQDDPLLFKVGKTRFKVLEPLPGTPLLEMVAAVGKLEEAKAAAGDKERSSALEIEIAVALRQFLLCSVPKADKDKLREALLASGASIDVLTEIAGYIVQEATGRPFTKPSSSEPSSPEPGESPRAATASRRVPRSST